MFHATASPVIAVVASRRGRGPYDAAPPDTLGVRDEQRRRWDPRDPAAAAPDAGGGTPRSSASVSSPPSSSGPRANLNLSVANVALPSIGEAFDASQTPLNLIAVGYSLGLAASVLYLGAVGDRYGRKLLLLLGVGLSVPASLLRRSHPTSRC